MDIILPFSFPPVIELHMHPCSLPRDTAVPPSGVGRVHSPSPLQCGLDHVTCSGQFDINGVEKSVGLRFGWLFALAACAPAMGCRANRSQGAEGSRGDTCGTHLNLRRGLKLKRNDPQEEVESPTLTCRPVREKERCGQALVGGCY